VVQRDVGEIGMHLHAWNSPPLVPLTDDDFVHQPFLTEYPPDVVEEKVGFMTSLLRDRFETPIVSHRAGRWALDEHYARTLARFGYRVDCSVCPNVSWRSASGAPSGQGGPDYRAFPAHPYLMDLDHIHRAGQSDLLELPMSVVRSPLHRIAPWAYRTPLLRRWAWRGLPDRIWLYPDGHNLAHLHFLVEDALATRRPYLQMVIHSSELMPGGGPHAPDTACVENLYRELHALFALVEKSFVGMTLSQYRTAWLAARQRPPTATSPSERSPAAAAGTVPPASAHLVAGDLG
jgi:hypothetical protein